MVLGILNSISAKKAKKKSNRYEISSQYLKGRNKTVNLSLLAHNMTVYIKKKIRRLQTSRIQQSF